METLMDIRKVDGIFGQWKRRIFKFDLNTRNLHFHNRKNKLKFSFVVEDYIVADSISDTKTMFRVTGRKSINGKFDSSHSTFEFAAPTEDVQTQWVNCLTNNYDNGNTLHTSAIDVSIIHGKGEVLVLDHATIPQAMHFAKMEMIGELQRLHSSPTFSNLEHPYITITSEDCVLHKSKDFVQDQASKFNGRNSLANATHPSAQSADVVCMSDPSSPLASPPNPPVIQLALKLRRDDSTTPAANAFCCNGKRIYSRETSPPRNMRRILCFM